MIKIISFFLLFGLFCNAQTNLGKWKDYFSFFNVLDVFETQDNLICATENGLFTYDFTTGEIQKISKATGLNGVKISAAAYNSTYNYTLVCYTNGAFDVITPNGIEYFVDIPIDTDFQGSKAVNHVYTIDDKAVFSMDFGTVIFNLENLEFDQTTYFRNGNNYIVAHESVMYNNTIYSVTNAGVFYSEINNLLSFFPGWTQIFNNIPYTKAEVFNNTLVLASGDNLIQSTDGVSFSNLGNFPTLVDIKTSFNHFAVVTNNTVKCFNSEFTQTQNNIFNETLKTGICTQNNNAYGGTFELGLLDHNNQTKIVPDGPYNNQAYTLTILEDKIWVAPGGRNLNFNQPTYDTKGYYYFDGNSWSHASYLSLNSTSGIMDLQPNPLNTDEVFASSYAQGILKTTNNVYDQLYNPDNSSVLNLPRVVGSVFDKNGNLYATQSFTGPGFSGNNLIFKSPTNQWTNFELNMLGTGLIFPELDPENWLWIGSARREGGLIAYNTNNTPLNLSDDQWYLLDNQEGSGNLTADNFVYSLGVDKNNTIWIGTSLGLRVFRNPHNALESGYYNSEPIVIVQNGIPEELLKDVPIYDIAIDEANRKWVATGGGVFYFSEDGQETLLYFNKNNSPLPVDLVTDIKIDSNTGLVYFATSDGIVSYNADITTVTNSFTNVYSYPNPVRPGFEGNIIIKGLPQNAKVKITDINGNLMNEGKAKGGIYEWNQKNLYGNKVASGIYIALMLNNDNTEKATTKIAIVR